MEIWGSSGGLEVAESESNMDCRGTCLTHLSSLFLPTVSSLFLPTVSSPSLTIFFFWTSGLTNVACDGEALHDGVGEDVCEDTEGEDVFEDTEGGDAKDLSGDTMGAPQHVHSLSLPSDEGCRLLLDKEKVSP